MPPPFATFDPFFDGVQGMPGQMQQPQQTAQESAVGGQYRDPSQNQLFGERTADMVMPNRGMRGTIIPHATLEGIPAGTRPHDVQRMQIHIDPHIPGQGSTVNLGDLTPARVREAAGYAQQTTPDPTDLGTFRFRSAVTMRAMGNGDGQAIYNPQVDEVLPTPQQQNGTRMTQPAPAVQYQQPMQPVPQNGNGVRPQVRVVRPLTAFNNPPPCPQPQSREQRNIDLLGAPPVRQVQPPTKRVTFEIEHFGVHVAYYHDVLIQPGFLVLVHRLGDGSEPYFPPHGENAPPMAVFIDGGREVFLIQVTGFNFTHDNTAYCVLSITQAAAAQDVQG